MKRLVMLPLTVLCLAAFTQPLHAAHDFAPDRRDMKRIRDLARELDRAADDLEDAFHGGHVIRRPDRDDDRRHDRDRHGRGYDHDRDRIADAAERFAERAKYFERTVERNMRHPERTVGAFRELWNGYRHLTDRHFERRLPHRAGRHFDRVQVLVADISDYYRRSRRPRVDWERVQYLAHQIDRLADNVYDEAKRELTRRASPRYDRRVREALDRFDDLRDAAKHFHRQVEKGRRDPAHIRGDFDRLVDARYAAGRHVWHLEYATRRAFQRMTALIEDLDSRCYGRDRDRRYVNVPPAPRAPVRTAPAARPINFEDDWPRILASLLGGELKF